MTTTQRRSPLRRPGCVIGLMLWFLLLLSPCLLVFLAARGEISINTGSAPEETLRIWLIQEADQRGLGLSTAYSLQQSEDAICVQTSVSFLLWEGEAAASQYCECYQQSETGWQATSVSSQACPTP